MRVIGLRLDGRRPRRWHGALVERLAARPGFRVAVDDRPCAETWPAKADLLFRLETLAHGLPQSGPAARLDERAMAAWPRLSIIPRSGPRFAEKNDAKSERSKQACVSEATQACLAGVEPDLVIDLCGDVEETGGVPVWRLLYDGRPGETALFASLLDGRVPLASLIAGDREICSARMGTEVRGVVLTMFEDALSRTVSMLAAAFDGGAVPLSGARPAPPPEARLTSLDLGRRALRIAARGAAQRLYRRAFHAPHWRIGWRRFDGPDLVALGRHPESGWRELPDDGRRFYADPFPIVHRGRCWLFVEEFPHATAKGVISAVAFDAGGPASIPVPVLETEHHLSYPFVFERDGEVWMVPECCAGGTIDLYRARDFPGGWVKERTLVSGVVASDATLFERDGRWWMFATVREAPASAPLGYGSYSDALHLWSAPDFRGLWTAHKANPVVIDTASARPAGRVVLREGQAIRPVQDCTEGYGRALALLRIDRLDDEGFAQSLLTRIEAGPLWPGSRLHSLNAAGGFEFIDGSARVARFLPARLARRP